MSGTGFIPDPSWPSIVELATHVWGQPTEVNHNGNEYRFGAKGSKAVLVKECVWRDHEAGTDGGYIQMWYLVFPGQNLPPRRNGYATHEKIPPYEPREPRTPPTTVVQPPATPRVKPWEDVDERHRYPYEDARGGMVLEVYRTKSGTPRFKQRAPDGTFKNGEPKWRWSVKHLPEHRTLLYRLPALLAAGARTVWICEGEKDVGNVEALGLVATTNIGGAGKWRAEYVRTFMRRHVVVLADNDPQSVDEKTGELKFHPDGRPVLVGQDHAEAVAAALYGNAASVRVLHLPGLPIKGDVSDWIAAGGTREQLEQLARDTPEWTPPPAPPEPEPKPKGGGEPPEPPPPEGDPGGPGRDEDGRPIIVCLPGELPRMVRQAEAALLAAGAEVYQRHQLVRPIEEEYPAADGRITHSSALLSFTPASLLKLLSNVALWVKPKQRGEGMVTCNPPPMLVQILLDGKGDWTFPHIRGVLTCPTLRVDGSVLKDRGYDTASRYYLAMPSNLVMPEMPDNPTRADAEAALSRLSSLLGKFPFVDDVSKAVAFCILMTQTLRCAMQVSPLLAVSATAPGSGKSFLIDLASAIALGRPCPVIPPGKDENETEKGIRTKLIGGTPAFSIDNVYGGINLPLLNMATERTHISIRLFSVLEEVEVENSVVIYANGNNMPIIDEQGRRTLRCCLDASEERPEFRVFNSNPIDTVMADRGCYIAAILTIARAYLSHLANGGERPDVPPMGDSHKTWSKLVREPLVWLGQEDPIKSQEKTREDDPVSTRLGALIDAWHAAFGMGPKTLAEAVKFATTPPILRGTSYQNYPTEEDRRADAEEATATYHAERACQEELLAALRDGFAAGKDGVNTHALGMWLRRFEGRMSDGFKFVRAKEADTKHKGSGAHWKLAKA